MTTTKSPLAEGRELKSECDPDRRSLSQSPLAEGRELKYVRARHLSGGGRVAPRGGA